MKKFQIIKGFTLIEILVVVTVIGVLLGTVAISYSSLSKSSRDSRRKADLEQVRAALEMYRSNNDEYPTGNNWSNLSVLTANDYLGQLPTDPKDPTYTYGYTSTDGSDYTLGAHLEENPTCASPPVCTGGCNYCVGPYGQKP